MDRAVPRTEVGPPGSPCRRRSQTATVSCRSRAGVGSDCGEGPLPAGQVCDEKTNMCKPLLTQCVDDVIPSASCSSEGEQCCARDGGRSFGSLALRDQLCEGGVPN